MKQNQGWGIVCALSFLLTIPTLMFIYPYLNTSNHGVHSLKTSLDSAIPFIKIFVLPYTAWVAYIFFSLIFLCFKDHRLACKTILVFDLGLIICFTIYYFYQTVGPARPVISGHDFLSRLLEFIYQIDKPYNSFPSIHVMSSYLLIRALRNCSWKNKWHQWIIGCFSTSIILATLFIKQHLIVDVIASILLVEFSFYRLYMACKGISIKNSTLRVLLKRLNSYSVSN